MSTTTPEPLDPSFQISLPSFEGPLDLLLHLIRKHELDILDLPIAFVTERYLSYITIMEQLDLDIASEYLVMAATLAHIKSKMLLPQEPEDQPDEETSEEELDPRAELIRRLLEYQKYKNAAEQLGARGIAGRDVFLRGSDAPEASGPPPLAPTSLFKLLDAFQAVLKRAKAEVAFEITSEGMSIQDRMRELVELLRERREVTFEALFDGKVTIYDLVITFMALLEMAKRRLVRIYQADPHSPIHLRSTVLGEDGEAAGADAWSDDAAAHEAPSEPGAATAPEPAAEAEPEPVPVPEPAEEAESATEPEPEPAAEAELATVHEPEPEPAPATEPELDLATEPEAESDPAAEPALEPASPIEQEPEPEWAADTDFLSMLDLEPVAESPASWVEPEPVAWTLDFSPVETSGDMEPAEEPGEDAPGEGSEADQTDPDGPDEDEDA